MEVIRKWGDYEIYEEVDKTELVLEFLWDNCPLEGEMSQEKFNEFRSKFGYSIENCRFIIQSFQNGAYI